MRGSREPESLRRLSHRNPGPRWRELFREKWGPDLRWMRVCARAPRRVSGRRAPGTPRTPRPVPGKWRPKPRALPGGKGLLPGRPLPRPVDLGAGGEGPRGRRRDRTPSGRAFFPFQPKRLGEHWGAAREPGGGPSHSALRSSRLPIQLFPSRLFVPTYWGRGRKGHVPFPFSSQAPSCSVFPQGQRSIHSRGVPPLPAAWRTDSNFPQEAPHFLKVSKHDRA